MLAGLGIGVFEMFLLENVVFTSGFYLEFSAFRVGFSKRSPPKIPASTDPFAGDGRTLVSGTSPASLEEASLFATRLQWRQFVLGDGKKVMENNILIYIIVFIVCLVF